MMPTNVHALICDGVIYDRCLTDQEFEPLAAAGLPQDWQAVHLELPIDPDSPKLAALMERPMSFWDGNLFPWQAGVPFPVEYALAGYGVTLPRPTGPSLIEIAGRRNG